MMRVAALLITGAGMVLLMAGGTAIAYPQYSVNKDATNCRGCHGDFDASTYTSLSDGGTWTDGLHNTHRDVMLDGDCDTCHSAGPKFPVLLGSSLGGTGLDPISCSGCHGRADDGTGVGSVGYGAGLRQHHWRNGIQTCGSVGCHVDADPAAYTPVDEDVLPPYYSDSDPDHPLIPGDPCNLPADGFPEDYASTTLGLDNDGDDFYDDQDLIPCPEPGEFLMLSAGVAFLGMAGRRRAVR